MAPTSNFILLFMGTLGPPGRQAQLTLITAHASCLLSNFFSALFWNDQVPIREATLYESKFLTCGKYIFSIFHIWIYASPDGNCVLNCRAKTLKTHQVPDSASPDWTSDNGRRGNLLNLTGVCWVCLRHGYLAGWCQARVSPSYRHQAWAGPNENILNPLSIPRQAWVDVIAHILRVTLNITVRLTRVSWAWIDILPEYHCLPHSSILNMSAYSSWISLSSSL